jgi:parallel beta-helix repeat protein
VHKQVPVVLLVFTLLISSWPITPITKADGAPVFVPSDDYPTIQSAIDDPNVDMIIVSPGEYLESLYFPPIFLSTRKSITLMSANENPEETKIVATGNSAIRIERSNITIKGFTIEGPIGIVTEYASPEGYPNHIIITNNTINGVSKGIEIRNGNSTRIISNTISKSIDGISIYGSSGNVFPPNKFAIIGNKILDCSGDGIHVNSGNGLVAYNKISSCGNAGIFLDGYAEVMNVGDNIVTKCA